mgnify:CR=1 FL=1
MSKRKNQKGFTMVELLAAVAILGLLSAIAIVGVGKILDNANKKHYETQLDNMIMATKSLSQENRNILPKGIGKVFYRASILFSMICLLMVLLTNCR